MIELRASLTLGGARVEADIRTSSQTLALVGPSGGGKTTLLNMVAGLVAPDVGRIAIGDDVMFDSARGVNLKPEARRIGYVFQEPRLFPHYSVRGNLLYGARAIGEALIGFDDLVDWLGIRPLLDRKPAKLSGGEQQRIAIGRALLSCPRALLLDEPMSSLDEARREELLKLIASLRDRFAIPLILVSHRREEVERLALDVAQVEPGRKTTL